MAKDAYICPFIGHEACQNSSAQKYSQDGKLLSSSPTGFQESGWLPGAPFQGLGQGMLLQASAFKLSSHLQHMCVARVAHQSRVCCVMALPACVSSVLNM